MLRIAPRKWPQAKNCRPKIGCSQERSPCCGNSRTTSLHASALSVPIRNRLEYWSGAAQLVPASRPCSGQLPVSRSLGRKSKGVRLDRICGLPTWRLIRHFAGNTHGSAIERTHQLQRPQWWRETQFRLWIRICLDVAPSWSSSLIIRKRLPSAVTSKLKEVAPGAPHELLMPCE